ncbi:unnamed protein product [Protopolystoma xenopodis]|uniref:Uncharacterized protein n=1 Tax=Protopolystoma xenopodis TaxID=117903 RepID=A0A448X1B2_9PLAT|nr:unnamed protein product [Protopolystoma xenopodis]
MSCRLKAGAPSRAPVAQSVSARCGKPYHVNGFPVREPAEPPDIKYRLPVQIRFTNEEFSTQSAPQKTQPEISAAPEANICHPLIRRRKELNGAKCQLWPFTPQEFHRILDHKQLLAGHFYKTLPSGLRVADSSAFLQCDRPRGGRDATVIALHLPADGPVPPPCEGRKHVAPLTQKPKGSSGI